MQPSTAGGKPRTRIELRDVVVRVAGRTILDHVDLEIDDGLTAIVGPSGSGKSRLLRLMNRLDAPSAGTVRLDGVDLADLDPLSVRRRVAMVFQRPLVFPGTVHANLTIANPQLSRVESVAALARVGLPESLVDQDAETLSGGEAQRLALGRALVNEPEVLLADEATSSLDHDAAVAIDALFRRLASDGMTIVVVTHDAAQARALATHIIVVINGAVRAVGSAEELAASQDPAVRAAIGVRS